MPTGCSDDPVLRSLAQELASYPTDPGATPGTDSPVVALELETPSGVMRLLGVTSRLEMPTDCLLEGMHLETFLPVDDFTRSSSGSR